MTFSLALTLQTYAPETGPVVVSAPTITSGGLVDSGPVWRVTTNSPNSGNWHWARVADGTSAPTPDGEGGWTGAVLETGTLAVGASGADLQIPETGMTGVTYQLFLYQRTSAESNVVVVTYIADNTPPQLTDLAFNTSGGTGSWSVTTDAAGTLWAVVTNAATAPTKAQIQDQQDHTGGAAVHGFRADPTGAGEVASGALNLPGPAYHVHLYQVDTAGNETSVHSLDATSAPGDFVDTFTDPDGTLLKTKSDWTEVVSGSFDVEVQSGIAQDTAVAGNLVDDDRVVLLANFATADDSELEIEIERVSNAFNNADYALIFRYMDPDNFLGLRINQSQYILFEREGGTETTFSNGTFAFAPGDVLRARCVSRTLTVWVNETEIKSVTAWGWGGIRAGGNVGMWLRSRTSQNPNIPSIRRFTARNL